MDTQTELVVFRVDQQRYALPLQSVERIVRAAEVTRLPNAPANVIGVVDVAGRIIPVLDIRQRFRHESRTITPMDHFVIAQTSRRDVILAVDEALGVITSDEATAHGVESVDQIQGAITLDDGMLLIQDLEKFLTTDDEAVLDQALNEGTSNAA
jgi:purine-binding chemotaxis protein CheW